MGINEDDLCPGTEGGPESVDEFGCSILQKETNDDSDLDGVKDEFDPVSRISTWCNC